MGSKTKPKRKTGWQVRKLDQEHIDFLTSQDTLMRWAGRTFKERCKLFHRIYPDKRIAITSLRRLYLKHKIKRKKVRQEKIKPGHVKATFEDQKYKKAGELDQARKKGHKILFLDEINFT